MITVWKGAVLALGLIAVVGNASSSDEEASSSHVNGEPSSKKILSESVKKDSWEAICQSISKLHSFINKRVDNGSLKWAERDVGEFKQLLEDVSKVNRYVVFNNIVIGLIGEEGLDKFYKDHAHVKAYLVGETSDIGLDAKKE